MEGREEDDSGIPRKKIGKERRQERENTRVYLSDAFQEWQRQKEAHNARTEAFHSASLFSRADLNLRGVKTHANFAHHILEVHGQHCQFCSVAQPGPSSGPMQMAVSALVYVPPSHSDATTQTDSEIPVAVVRPASSTVTSEQSLDTPKVTWPSVVATSTPVAGPSKEPATTTMVKRNLHQLYEASPIMKDVLEEDMGSDDGMTSDEEDDIVHFLPDDSYKENPEEPQIYQLENESAEGEVFQSYEEVIDDLELDESIGEEGTTDFDSIEEAKCIAPIPKLIELLKMCHGNDCSRKNCNEPLTYNFNNIGTAVVFTWTCRAGHNCGTWRTQERFCNMFCGNLQFSSAVTLSGNNFSKIQFFFKVCKIFFVGRSTFQRVQRLYVFPSVKAMWKDSQAAAVKALEGKEVSLAGDGRTDSPGHSAQYCTYSFMDTTTLQIIHVEVVDVREVNGKSPNMEKLAFKRGMDSLMKSVKIKDVVTDAHPQIMALMKNCDKYDQINHQVDVWHGAKNFVKKVSNVANEKGNRDLQLWIPAVRNHFWFSAGACAGNLLKLKSIWFSLLHHIANEHEWVLSIDGSVGKCQHESLNESDRQKPWLKKGSSSHKALTEVMTKKRFLNTLRYYTGFKHTGQLESFHNHMLMYASKRCSYSYPGYSSRMLLAAIDHNYHLDREYASTVDGKLVYKAKFNKRSRKWAPQRVRVPKSYGYVPDLMQTIFLTRKTTPGHLSQRAQLSDSDPRNIQSNIASVPRPSTETLVHELRSRFTQQSAD